jgi:hypothetical protein
MKCLSYLALVGSLTAFATAAYAGGHHRDGQWWRCWNCNNKDCLRVTAVYSRDEFKAIALSNCLICTSQYKGNCCDD